MSSSRSPVRRIADYERVLPDPPDQYRLQRLLSWHQRYASEDLHYSCIGPNDIYMNTHTLVLSSPSELPDHIADRTTSMNITTLCLKDCAISLTNGYGAIKTLIESMDQLETLIIVRTYLKEGTNVTNLLRKISQCCMPKLRTIVVKNYILDKRACEHLSRMLMSMNITGITLQCNSLNDDSFDVILHALLARKDIKHIIVRDNSILQSAEKLIEEGSKIWHMLETLILSDITDVCRSMHQNLVVNYTGGQVDESLFTQYVDYGSIDSLVQLLSEGNKFPMLKTLGLSYGIITNKKQLVKFIADHEALEILSISYCNLDVNGLFIPEFRRLSFLDISGNHMELYNCVKLGEVCGKTIAHLALHGCNLTHESLTQMFYACDNWERLVGIDLSLNHIVDVPQFIPFCRDVRTFVDLSYSLVRPYFTDIVRLMQYDECFIDVSGHNYYDKSIIIFDEQQLEPSMFKPAVLHLSCCYIRKTEKIISCGLFDKLVNLRINGRSPVKLKILDTLRTLPCLQRVTIPDICYMDCDPKIFRRLENSGIIILIVGKKDYLQIPEMQTVIGEEYYFSEKDDCGCTIL